jgi:biotin-dependent carboxylase-like uncharacterized protein
VLEVIEPGLLSTIQDAGRRGFAHMGVPVSGACDTLALAVANLLVGNDPGDAAIEMTLVGPSLAVKSDCLLGLAGADLGIVVEGADRTSRPFAFGTSRLVPAGSVIRPTGAGGCRAYLALGGGIDVPEVLGSRSTCLPGGFGGLDGRPLGSGDRLRSRRPGETTAGERAWPLRLPAGGRPEQGPIRLLPGPHTDRFPADALARFLAMEWTVSAHSDRTAVRLEPLGEPIVPLPEAATMVSQPMTWGAIQVPPDGQPVILLADHRTVGGYPVLAVVPRVDHPAVGQLAPAESVRFAPTSLESAREAFREARATMQRIGDQFAGR